jgi:hypothetical protein
MLAGQGSDASLLTLLVGVALRGELCDAERELFDRFAAPNTLIFLVQDRTFVHPDHVEIVSLDQIEATFSAGDDAVFSHRQHLSDDLGRKTKMIRTARVGQTGKGALVLGMIGAELPELRAEHDRHFGSVVQLVRTSLKGLAPLIEWLEARMAVADPILVVGRSTGRLLAVNEAARALLAPASVDPIGQEFSQIKHSLLRDGGRGRLSMENRSQGGLDVTVISVTRPTAGSGVNGSQVGARFLESMRHKTAGITAAARFLQTALDHEPGHPVTEMLKVIIDESAELDHDLCRHQLLVDYGRLAPETLDPVSSLRKAIEVRMIGHACHSVSLKEELVAPVRVEVPRSALMFLYESILSTHCGPGSRSKTEATVRHNGGSGVTVTFNTDCGRPLNQSAYTEWREYCDRLAGTMGVQLTHRTSRDYAKTETILTLKA